MGTAEDRDIRNYALYDELPSDWHYLYIGNKYNDNCCVFCQKTINISYKIIQHKQYSFYACTKCNDKLEDIKNKIDETKRKIEKKKMSKLDDFIYTGRFPESAIELAFHNKNECVFCGNEDYHLLEIQAPQDQFNIVIKPNKICRPCKNLIPQNLKSLSKDRCSLCLKEYYVSNGEMKQRSDLGTVGDHICNECLVAASLENEMIQGSVKCPSCGKASFQNISLEPRRFTAEHCGCETVKRQPYALPLTVDKNQIKIPFREGHGEREGIDNIITIVKGFIIENDNGDQYVYSLVKQSGWGLKIDVYRIETKISGNTRISFKGETLFCTKIVEYKDLVEDAPLEIYKKISELHKTIINGS